MRDTEKSNIKTIFRYEPQGQHRISRGEIVLNRPQDRVANAMRPDEKEGMNPYEIRSVETKSLACDTDTSS